MASNKNFNYYSVSSWVRFIGNCQGSVEELYAEYEKSLQYLPRSYKLWKLYLRKRVANTNKAPFIQSDPDVCETVSCFERAIHYLNKMPKLW